MRNPWIELQLGLQNQPTIWPASLIPSAEV